MKKIMFVLLLAAAAVFAASPLFAEGMMFGVKGGLNMANVIGDDAEDTSMKIGAVGGIFMCYNFTEIFAIQPELLFSMKGAKSDNEEGIEEAWTLNYFEIPLLFKVTLPTDGKVKPLLYAGPALGILMSAKVEDEDIKEHLKSMDIGVVAGAGIDYRMESGTLSFEARYEVGMSSIYDLDDETLELWELEDQPDVLNSVISIMVGYGFAF